MTASEVIDKYISFFQSHGHKKIPNASLVPSTSFDTTLFTTAGMQPLLPYLMGQTHPQGRKLVNIQRCLRTDDMDEVGDSSHHTFYEMLGNWSLGNYWKKEAITLSFNFLIKELGIPIRSLAITIFAGDEDAPKDEESESVWKDLGVPKERIFSRPKKDNWWGPVGKEGPCGPDTEMFFWLGEGDPVGIPSENSNWVEIWNDVFMEYYKKSDGTFEPLRQKNVDTGMGLERIATVLQNKESSYETDIFKDLYLQLKNEAKMNFENINNTRERRIRIFLDHSRASIFLINDGILPGKNEREAVLRRLIRGATDQLTFLLNDTDHIKAFAWWTKAFEHFKKVYSHRYNFNDQTKQVIEQELKDYGEKITSPQVIQFASRFSLDENVNRSIVEDHLKKTLPGTNLDIFLRQNSLSSLPSVSAGTVAFEAKSTQGFPMEQTFMIAEKKLGDDFVKDDALKTVQIWQAEHKKVSNISAAKKFAGGLADSKEKTIMGHTVTHLLHQALRDVLGNSVHQTGSNITSERLRFDFNYDKALTDAEIGKVESIINEKIKDNLPVHFEMLLLKDAKEMGAIGLFDEKYQDKVKVYFIGNYSKEFCGGPHVDFTGKLKKVKILKQENIGNGKRRIYATVEG